MNPTIYSYTARLDERAADSPDLCIYRNAGETVYTVHPLTPYGAAFVMESEYYEQHEYRALVPMSSIFPFMNEVFDMGMRVV